jgi:alkylation response protein AidB-like acyl-CoA dehydrogenase
MEFCLNQEQIILKNEVRRFLQNECTMDFVKEMIEDEKGYSPSLWKKMAELGWVGVLFEEKYGGAHGTFLDLSIILEEIGRSLLPSPFFSTVILGGLTIMLGGDEALKRRYLPGIASGDIIMTAGLKEMGGNYAAEAIQAKGESNSDMFMLQGEEMFVSDAHIADHMIFLARTFQKDLFDEVSLFIVDAKSEGVSLIPLRSLHLQKQFKVSLKNVYASKNNLVGKEGQGQVLIQKMWPVVMAGRCSEMLGAMQRVLEITLNYVQQRRQFDRPLSAFQVIQHYCADMAIELECSRYIINQAVWRVSNDLPSRKEVAMAKAWSSDAFKKITKIAHQIHGGIGFTKEHDLNLYFRYAKAEELTFGDANFYKEIVAREMDL